MITRKYLFVSAIIVLFVCHSGLSQSENVTIEQQFENVISRSETYSKYKVIAIDRLNNLVTAVNDSLSDASVEIGNLKSKIDTQKAQIGQLNEQIASLTTNLNESRGMNDQISFLGISFQKTTYNVFVWSLMLALGIVLGLVYVMFKRSNLITRKTQKDLSALSVEFDSYKASAKEKQVKLKRELQTAINTINERGIKV